MRDFFLLSALMHVIGAILILDLSRLWEFMVHGTHDLFAFSFLCVIFALVGRAVGIGME
jgi:hypothetical protein